MSLTMENKKFLFYLTDTPTGSCYYVDSSGNLYAGLSGNLGTTDSGGIRIYVPPFSGASAPNVTTGVFGTTLAIGK